MSADNKSDLSVLNTIHTSEMYSTALGSAVYGTALGTATSLSALYLLRRNKLITLPIRAFIGMAGAAAGFTIASDRAIVHYIRTHPSIVPSKKEEAISESRASYTSQLTDKLAQHKIKVIFGAWLASMSAVIYNESRKKHLNTVHKFGHARIAAQFVTIGAIFVGFAFNDKTGPWADKYQPGFKRDL